MMEMTIKDAVLTCIEAYERALLEDYRQRCQDVSQLPASAEVLNGIEGLDQDYFSVAGVIYGMTQMAVYFGVMTKDEAKKRSYDYTAALGAITNELLEPASVRWELELGIEQPARH